MAFDVRKETNGSIKSSLNLGLHQVLGRVDGEQYSIDAGDHSGTL